VVPIPCRYMNAADREQKLFILSLRFSEVVLYGRIVARMTKTAKLSMIIVASCDAREFFRRLKNRSMLLRVFYGSP
jgi:hypothetical protein